jgi:hypothetical protein
MGGIGHTPTRPCAREEQQPATSIEAETRITARGCVAKTYSADDTAILPRVPGIPT